MFKGARSLAKALGMRTEALEKVCQRAGPVSKVHGYTPVFKVHGYTVVRYNTHSGKGPAVYLQKERLADLYLQLREQRQRGT